MFRTHIHRFRWLLVLVLLVAGSFATMDSALALEVMAQTIAQDEVIDDDVFIASETITVDGTVNGDLLAVGGTVILNGTVNGSLLVVAQRVVVSGNIEGTIYGGGGSITVAEQATIGRNMLFGGFSLNSEAGSRIERDLFFAGYQALLSGAVGRDVSVGVGALELAGQVGRDVTANVAAPSDSPPAIPMIPEDSPPAVNTGLRVSQEAEIGGTLTYSSETEQVETISAVPTGGIVYQEAETSATETVTESASTGSQMASWLFARIREWVTLLIIGALVLWRAPSLLKQLTHKAAQSPLRTAGWGLASLIGGFVAVVVGVFLIIVLGLLLGLITLGGLASTTLGIGFMGLGLLFLIFLFLVTYGSKVVVAWWAGKSLLERFAQAYAEHRYWPLVLGVLLYVILSGIPYLGGLISAIATLLGLGAIWLLFRHREAKESRIA